jgi:hypothetical protein
MDRAQTHFENSRFQGSHSGGRQPMVPLGTTSYDFPYNSTRNQEHQPFGGLGASINPQEPSGDEMSGVSLRLAVIHEELRRLEREKMAVDNSEIRLSREVDDQAKAILKSEHEMAQERDEALLKRSKRAEMLQTLQGVVTRYDEFFSGISR